MRKPAAKARNMLLQTTHDARHTRSPGRYQQRAFVWQHTDKVLSDSS